MEELEVNSSRVGPSVSNKVGRGDLNLNPDCPRGTEYSCTRAQGSAALWGGRSGGGALSEWKQRLDCVWLVTDEKLGGPEETLKQLLHCLAQCSSPPLARHSFPVLRITLSGLLLAG